jgi:hypothetical protein
MSPKKVWSQCLVAVAALLFSQYKWHGEAFCRLWFQGVEILILFGALFPPSVAPASDF